MKNHLLLNEGLTECLNGYVILKKHNDCYDTWKSSANGYCATYYPQSTRIFCSLAQIIGIKPIANFYLAIDKDFKEPWNRFIEDIHSAGFPKFKFELEPQKAYRESLFRDECIRSIKGFKKIYGSAIGLDFAKIC